MVYLLVRFSISKGLYFCGLIAIHPLAPPKGIPKSALYNVLKRAIASQSYILN